MELYNYAFLDDNGACHTIYQSSDERTDLVDGFVVLDDYDPKYLNALWKGSEWEFPPSEGFMWNGTEWFEPHPSVEQVEQPVLETE